MSVIDKTPYFFHNQTEILAPDIGQWNYIRRKLLHNGHSCLVR